MTVTPIAELLDVGVRESRPDEFADLLPALADLAVGARNERQRIAGLERAGDVRVRQALTHLAELEQHAYAVGVEAARVRHELQHAHLI